MENTPVNVAHAFANAAEELEEKEQWGKAMEAHFRAAEQFALAMNYTSDPEVIRTLKLLYTNHTRQGREVQRRLTKQAQQSPKPQEQLNPPSSHRTRKSSSSTSSKSNANNSQAKHNSEQQNQSKHGTSLSTQPITRSSSLEVQVTPSSNDRLSSDHMRTATTSGVSRTNTMISSTTPSVMDGSSDSEKTIEESYMMLKGNNDSTDDDDSDPFNKFWDIVEGLVQKISNPIAFATVPLNGADSRTTFDPNTIQSPMPFRYNAVNENIVDDSKVEELNAAMMESFYIIPKDQRPNYGSRSLGLPQSSSSLSPSAHRIPSDSKGSTTKTLEEYSIENKQLKAIIDNMSKRMLTFEKATEENNMLKSSILQFKNDVQKQAKRIKVSQEILRSSSIVKQISPESSTVGNAYLQRRIKELEEENRLLKSERDKQQELVTKYKDRWEKLKEAAKKKRENKQVEASTSPNENSSSSKSSSTMVSHNQNISSSKSPTFSKQSQLVLPTSPTTITVATTVNAVSTQPLQQSPSSSGTILPFALQKPQQRPGVGGILDVPSNSKNNNIFTTPRHSIPPTTTILHATSTGSSKLNADRMNFSSGSDSIEASQLAFLPHPQRRESAPAINSSSNSITTPNPTSQSMYH
ncbi:hypothetical protein C1645_741429 [Glomus cerebriforme]|uniref:Uncharacterized protein n=1 Tax=Glomus cerebriforme TaxID=658196 RepID=A0A397SHY3_9GLOM|nr:hypothetical protein C1645_741429 [Glomus cerebriforme]